MKQRRRRAKPDPNSRLGERVSELASRLGGKKKLAKIAEVSEVQIYRYINGENVPNVTVVAKLAEAAGVSVEWIVTGNGPQDLLVQEPGAPASGDGSTVVYQGRVDRVLLRHILVQVESYLERENIDLSAEERAETVADLYADVISAMSTHESRIEMANSILHSLFKLLNSRGKPKG